MVHTKNYFFAVILVINTLSPTALFGQSDNKTLIKAGGFVQVVNFYKDHKIIGYYLNFEREQSFIKAKSITFGLRADYSKRNPYYSSSPTSVNFSFGDHYLNLGAAIKVYPFHFILQKPYQGFFIGADLCYFTPIDKIYRNGPGIGALIGYQYVFKNRFSLGFEGCVGFMQNVNKAVPPLNPLDRYLFQFGNIKFGIKL